MTETIFTYSQLHACNTSGPIVEIKCEIYVMRPVVRFALLLFRCFCFVGICVIFCIDMIASKSSDLTKNYCVLAGTQFVYPGRHHFILCQFI